MWKSSTRKVLPAPKSLLKGRLLGLWSAALLLIAVIAGVVGFREGSPQLSGVARLVGFIAAACSVGLAGVWLALRRRSG
jgi:hypothetical protein